MRIYLLALLFLLGSQVSGLTAPLTATKAGNAMSDFIINGTTLPSVTASFSLVDPRTGNEPVEGRFILTTNLRPVDDALYLDVEINASGVDDTVVDAVLRVDGVNLPTGDGVTDLMLAQELVNKLPIAPLRTLGNEQDQLALAMPANAPYAHSFSTLPADKAVVMRIPLGFSMAAPEPLRMRAAFSIVIMQTNPQWHFRSALAQYYSLFPEYFARHEMRDGGWFFANATPEIPNPQHFAFNESAGPTDLDEERNMGTYPYSETSSTTLFLPGPGLPGSYEEAVAQIEALDKIPIPKAWELISGKVTGEVARSGKYSYQATAPDMPVEQYARQTIVFDEPVKGPFVVEAWSKAQDVSGSPDNQYSIYIDCLLANGDYLFGQCAQFNTGTHDWEHTTITIDSPQAIKDLRVYTMFRNHTGIVWFDDLKIYQADNPDENLLENSDFEQLGPRDDLKYIRDNVLVTPGEKMLFYITDNLSADIPPDSPLSLLRFACNVDPDWQAPEGRPTPASSVLKMYDTMFETTSIDGCYIDSVAAWCCWGLNTRKDHMAVASQPLTYDSKTFTVGQDGRFHMFKWLKYLQDRYHPTGKTIFGNMGPNAEVWTNYTVLDIIGIESSAFQNRALMGYHRFGGYHKPVLPMNFVNLHKLDDRATAEEFVLASTQWGEFPSTGRYVREGYQAYGDVCHTYYPPLKEMSRAGWEPEPLVTGCSAERFGTPGGPLYYTIRAPQEPREVILTVLPEALGNLTAPVVFDAVQLTPVDAMLTAEGLQIPITDGAQTLTILRISDRENALQWLLERAAEHCENAAIVRGISENTASLKALAAEIRALKFNDNSQIGPVINRLREAAIYLPMGIRDLEKTSTLTEIHDALRTLGEWVLVAADARLNLQGKLIVPVSDATIMTPTLAPGSSNAGVVGCRTLSGRGVLRYVLPQTEANETLGEAVISVKNPAPGVAQLLTTLNVPVEGAEPLEITRMQNVFFTPILTASAQRISDSPDNNARFRVNVQRLATNEALQIKAQAGENLVTPALCDITPQQDSAEFSVAHSGDGDKVTTVTFTLHLPGDQQVGATSAQFRSLPAPPDGNLTQTPGVLVISDSNYDGGYIPEVTVDGIFDATGLHWTKAAWASQDVAKDDGHWLEIILPEAKEISSTWIYWAQDNASLFTSRHIVIQAWIDDQWETVTEIKNLPTQAISKLIWPAVSTDRLRILQPRGGGPASRPNIMWISEVYFFNK